MLSHYIAIDITLHSEIYISTATIILPLNGANPNLPSSRTPAFDQPLERLYSSVNRMSGKMIFAVGMCIPTTTIVLPLNGLNSNLQNNRTRAFRQAPHFIKILKILKEKKSYLSPGSVVLERWTKRAKDVINAENGNSSTHRDPAFVTTYVMFLERCKRMANAVLKCGNPNYIHKTMEMVEQHTEILESYNMGEVDEMFDRFPETGTRLGNPQRVRKRGGATAGSSTRRANAEKKRSTPKCGICGGKGHNRVSCRFRHQETHSSNSNHE
ncbi:hypothetical protein MTR_0268s0050 [Medicago truncatula]|uniref:Uncharacterized protein n=1 Tax=Medicago truncatula TaxID=3880 RepID=A0A072TFA3_MEDTR|nr:hypothetical protein MTR_0268s0050 [Medicago truncatula]